jgi:hypothetical protein
MAVSDEDKRVYLRTSVEAHLTFLWQEADVSLDVQYRIAQSGFRTVQKFTSLADDRASLRAALLADFALDPSAAGAAGTTARLEVASVICSWEAASEVRSAAVSARADAQAQGISRPLAVTERSAMRRAYEAMHEKLPSCEVPSGEYLASKVEETEHEEPTASPLDEILCSDEGEAMNLAASLDSSGRLRLVRQKVKGKAPVSSEELRMRLRVECHTWGFIALKFSAKTWLQKSTPAAWQRYADYLLGEKVAELKVPAMSVGEKMSELKVPWAVVLHYEFEMRKSAFGMIRETGITIDEAISKAMRDSELKEVHFTSPLALMGRKRDGGHGDPPPAKWSKKEMADWRKGKGKGKTGKPDGKGGKDKGKGSKSWDTLSVTADGRQICFAFNTAAGCKVPACSRIHICRKKGCGSADHGLAGHPASAGA